MSVNVVEMWYHAGMSTQEETPNKEKQMTIRLDRDDMELIEQLKRDYGVRSTMAAIRLALRLSQSERFPLPREMEQK
jgi:hypothetical protein